MTSPGMSFPSIAFVGSGVMAEVIIRGLLTKKLLPPLQIHASGPRQERAAQLKQLYGIQTYTDNIEAIAPAQVVVLAVKPQNLLKVLLQLRPALKASQLVVTIVAGGRMASISQVLSHPAIVRAMPNLPCQIHRGMTVWTATDAVTQEQKAIVKEMLLTMGRENYVEDERDVDRATAVNGTGPAIVAYLIKALEDAANFIGESRPLARTSVLQTLMGTAEMVLESEEHIGELIDGVTSPGGTTSRALHVLRKGGVTATITDAIDTAFQRSVEMGDILDEEALKALKRLESAR